MSQTTIVQNGNYVGGEWTDGSGPQFDSICPVDQSVVWSGKTAVASDVAAACDRARDAFQSWCLTSLDSRIEHVRRFAEVVENRSDELVQLISRETGKPVWESKTEAGAVVGKAELSIAALKERRDTTQLEMDGFNAVTRYKPHGVVGVLGPFNFPAHLANGHMIPALLAGNTVVFKPSEQSPAVGAWLVGRWQDAGIPAGVVNLVQGGRQTGVDLVEQPQLDGLFFTGSSNAGTAIHKMLGPTPQKILALEMGGNNPLITHDFSNVRAVAYQTILSAYLTAGQRCTCARRLIVVEGESANSLIDEISKMIQGVRFGFYSDDPEPFMGTVISAESGRQLLASQQEMIDAGAKPVFQMQSHRNCDALLSPGLLDVTDLERNDNENFGPLLQIIRVKDFDAAIAEANNTAYGLSAGLLSDSRECYDHFIARIRAGVVNWNRQTTGASGKLPFGGCGLSGNHRPSGYFAADYCSFPVASLESATSELPEKPMQGIEFATH